MSCTTDQKKNLYLSKCNQFPSLLSGMFEVPLNTSIPKATLEDPALLKTYLQNGMLAAEPNRFYYWPDFDTFEDQSPETVYQSTTLSIRRVSDQFYQFKFGITQNLCLHKNMYTHRTNNAGVLLLDSEGNLIGTEESGTGNMRPLIAGMINTEKLKFSDGSVASESPIVVALRKPRQIDQNGMMVNIGSFIDELNRLVDLDVTVEVESDTVLTVTVKTLCDETPLAGLVTADFIVKDASGATQASTAFEDNGDGTYTITKSTDWVTGTVELRPATTLSLKAYEGPAPVEFEIV